MRVNPLFTIQTLPISGNRCADCRRFTLFSGWAFLHKKMKTGQEIYYLIMEMSASEQDKYFRTLTALEIDLFLGFVNDQ